MAYATIDDPSAHHHTQLFTGNDSNRTITNDANAGDFKPDLVWLKHRNHSTNHSNNLVDSSRGGTKTIYSNTSDGEETISTGITGFATDGFTISSNAAVNGNAVNYKAWQWKANGGTTTTNDASSTGVGNRDSVYQANTTAGFSIVRWTGVHPGNHTVAHGLGKTPKWIIFKNLSDNANWQVRHDEAGAYQKLPLNGTDQKTTDYNLGHGGSSTTFNLQNSNLDNGDGDEMVAYCWAPIKGYSRFGKYTGNGNNDGPFIYTGFKPAWLMIRGTNFSTDGWVVFDNKRDPYNGVQYYEFVNNGNAEGSGTVRLDFLSNGFKLRQSGTAWNSNGGELIYMAFAEHPYVSSEGIPVHAR